MEKIAKINISRAMTVLSPAVFQSQQYILKALLCQRNLSCISDSDLCMPVGSDGLEISKLLDILYGFYLERVPEGLLRTKQKRYELLMKVFSSTAK